MCFKDNDAAKSAMEAMNKKTLSSGKCLLVNQHISSKENQLSMARASKANSIQQTFKKSYDSNLYIKFIPSGVTQQELLDTFGQAGKIISSKLNTTHASVANESINLYQYAYILFDKVQEAQLAIKMYDQSTTFGGRPISVQFWQSKEELEQGKKEQSFRDLDQFIQVLGKSFSREFNNGQMNMMAGAY